MKTYEAEILTAMQACRAAFTENVVAEASSQPPIPGLPDIPPEAIEQFINGFFAFVEEALRDGSRDARAFYLSTAVPAIRDTGISAKIMVGGSVRTILRMSLQIAARVSVENRPAAERWLGDFFGDFIGDVAAVWSAPHG